MKDAPADRWEFSLLVDRASRIVEARGLFEHYFGVRANQLVGQHLISFLDESERLSFLRFMARMLVRGEVEPVIVTLHTSAIGTKRLAMEARNEGGGPYRWLVFAHHDGEIAAFTGLDASEQPFASGNELATLADAHDHAQLPLDLTLFRAQALRENQALPIPTEERKVLDDELGHSLREHAHQRIVARPDIGEYALLHGRGYDGDRMGQTLVDVAQRHQVGAKELGLVRRTCHLPGELPAGELIQDMRRRMRHTPAGSIALPLTGPSSFYWVPTAITGACGLLMLAAWLILRSRN